MVKILTSRPHNEEKMKTTTITIRTGETDKTFDDVLKVMEEAKKKFRSLLELIETTGGMTKERYCRYLSMQYHLTKNVQKPFLTVAGHVDMGRRRELRSFLVNFANEEEFHYEIARKDLEHLNVSPGECPLDVTLWWHYFDRIVNERPFVRLGATVILENINTSSRDVVQRLFGNADFLNEKNTVFFKIHQHEALPHGDQILSALSNPKNKLEPRHYEDLAEGARKGFVMYMRMAKWALFGEDVY